MKTRQCLFCGYEIEPPCGDQIAARGCHLYRKVRYGEGETEVDATDFAKAAAKNAELRDIKPTTYAGEPTLGPARPLGDAVTLPGHYTRWKVEPIYFIEENKMPFWMGNVIKYVTRADAKDGLQDLKKARRYIDMKIKQLEGDPDWSK